MAYVYRDYIRTLSDRFGFAISEIQVEHNFEYGDEFEIAVCKVLQPALPERFGVCRGYVTDMKGSVAGDDIIIYDRLRYPTLRPQGEIAFTGKQYIPIEAAYAYIEAKHSLDLDGDKGQSIHKAIRQVAEVKTLTNSRRPVELQNITPEQACENQWPLIANPMYGMVVARNVRMAGVQLNPDEVRRALPVVQYPGPDMIIAGESTIALPALYATLNGKVTLQPFGVRFCGSLPSCPVSA